MDVHEKLRKLLSLARNNPSPQEAAAARAQAERLAKKHGLELDEQPTDEQPAAPGGLRGVRQAFGLLGHFWAVYDEDGNVVQHGWAPTRRTADQAILRAASDYWNGR